MPKKRPRVKRPDAPGDVLARAREKKHREEMETIQDLRVTRKRQRMAARERHNATVEARNPQRRRKTDLEKKVGALARLLRSITELKERQRLGHSLDAQQIVKIEREADVKAQLKQLLPGEFESSDEDTDGNHEDAGGSGESDCKEGGPEENSSAEKEEDEEGDDD